MIRKVRLGALAAALAWTAAGQVAILHIRPVTGEGSIHAAGSRSPEPLAVVVTDEMGRPVAGAAVSFHLPEEGPGGSFGNGLRTQVASTDGRGRASVRGLRLNRLPGPFQIRVIASKEQARAGIVLTQYVAPSDATKAAPRRRKWATVLALIGGGAAAGTWAASRPAKTPRENQPSAVSVGGPTIWVGGPSIPVGAP